MKIALVAVVVLVLAGSAAAQLGPQSSPPAIGTTAPPKGGADDGFGPGAAGWSRKVDANGRMREDDYRAELARSIAKAEALAGQPLTDRDRGKIRNAIRGDLLAWRKQYDPRRADYREMHDRWLVDEASLSADGWAKQRVDWLHAQQQWIIANVGGSNARTR